MTRKPKHPVRQRNVPLSPPSAVADNYDRLLPLSYVREILMCSRQKIYQLHRDGELTMVKFRGSTRVTDTSLRAFLVKLPRAEIKQAIGRAKRTCA